MPARNISPAILIVAVAGSVLAYSGVKGKSISKSFQALLAGQSPADTAQATGIPTLDDSTGFNLTTSASSGGVSEQSFFSDVLRGLGAPVTSGALATLAGVVHTEGVNNYYNPFNIEWHPGDNTAWQGSGNFNSAGVQKYGSYAEGVNATVAFLQNNSRWSNVVAALKSGNEPMGNAALQAVYSSWGGTFKPASASDASSELSAPVGG